MQVRNPLWFFPLLHSTDKTYRLCSLKIACICCPLLSYACCFCPVCSSPSPFLIWLLEELATFLAWFSHILPLWLQTSEDRHIYFYFCAWVFACRCAWETHECNFLVKDPLELHQIPRNRSCRHWQATVWVLEMMCRLSARTVNILKTSLRSWLIHFSDRNTTSFSV